MYATLYFIFYSVCQGCTRALCSLIVPCKIIRTVIMSFLTQKPYVAVGSEKWDGRWTVGSTLTTIY